MKIFSSFRMFTHSIRFRLVGWFTIILVLVLLAFSSFVYFNQARDIRGDAAYHLNSKLNDIEDALRGSPKSTPILQPGDVFVLFDSDGNGLVQHGITSSTEALALLEQAQSGKQQDEWSSDRSLKWWLQDWKSDGQAGSGRDYFFIVRSILVAGKPGLAILGSPFDPYGLDSRLTFSLLLGSLLTVAVALGGGLWLADRAMRPVHAITQAALSISETDLNRRLHLKGRDELAELANTFDGMLARLQAAFERQRQFVADASHELRTPLTIVNLESSRALSSSRSAQEYQRALGVIRSENELMTRLVNDLLTLARMDSGQLGMQKTSIDLSDVGLEALERLAPLAEKKNVRLETGDLAEVIIQGDRQYLLQMISNLVENGIKYSLGEGKRVRLETGSSDGFSWVRVSDTGEGIDAEYLPHLFDRFYRVDKARYREDVDQQGGTGLGLSIVDWIARAHGGEVRVESAPGAGTLFEVRFNTIS
jgi:signal transduction histidine kinase/cbb3-type cytochrome oxidase subunit 3